MTRYRALFFGKPVAPWQATPELARQSAVETDNAHREPGSGRVYLSPGVEIEEAEGGIEITPDMERWAEAMAVISVHRDRALRFADERIAKLQGDQADVTRWRAIRSRIVQILEAAAKDAGQ